MEPAQLEAMFDQQSANYGQQWAKLAAFRDGIHLLMGSLFARLPERARMLCVGAGTGAEIQALASRFPAWTFTAVEPSAGMVAVAQKRARDNGYADRRTFHTGYLETLPSSAPFDCASVSPERVLQMQEAHAKDVAILAPKKVAAMIAAAGFGMPVQFYQAGPIHAWYTHRLPG